MSSDDPPKCIKYRYIVHGVPKNKRYTVEEAKWCDKTNRFVSEITHTLSPIYLKQWLGYVPSVIGDMKTVMWMCVMCNCESPLIDWIENHSVFGAQNLEKMRFFPQGTCEEQASCVSR